MSWLKRLIHGVPREPDEPPTFFETGWEVLRAYLHDLDNGVTVHELTDDHARFTVKAIDFECTRDPDPKWLTLRTYLSWTEEQKQDELVMYQEFSHLNASQSAFRFDVDKANQRYIVDGGFIVTGQYSQVLCVKYVIWLTELLLKRQPKERYDLYYQIFVVKQKNLSVDMAIWGWLSSQEAPVGTTGGGWNRKEQVFQMSGAECTIAAEPFYRPMVAAFRYGMNDFQKYFQKSNKIKSLVYYRADDIRKNFPHLRIFIYESNGVLEFSMPILISEKSNSLTTFRCYLQEVMNSLADYTEDHQDHWRADWFDPRDNRRPGADHYDPNKL